MHSRVERLGRLSLLGAVAFWWGGVVLPHLVSLAFPTWLPPDRIPRQLNPDFEGSTANAVSTIALAGVALLAIAAAIASHRRADRWIAVGGWASVGVTSAAVSVEEAVDLKAGGWDVAGETLGAPYPWPEFVTPLVAAFVLLAAYFAVRGLRTAAERTPFVLGLIVWLLALLADLIWYPVLSDFIGLILASLIEETLEFGGALLVGLSAAIALKRLASAPDAERVGRLRMLPILIGSIVTVAIMGSLVLGCVFRVPLEDLRGRTHIGTFDISLPSGASITQELAVLPAPLDRIDLQMVNDDPAGRPGGAIWRIVDASTGDSQRFLVMGRTELPAGIHSRRVTIDFPPLSEATVRPLALQVVADVAPHAHLRVSATKSARDSDNRLWINDAPAWSDQSVRLVAFSAPEPTLSKLRAIGYLLASDWRWPMILVVLAVSLTLICLIPAVLVVHATRRIGRSQL